MEWSLTLKNWRGLEEVQWSPEGVCLLAGPNGSGKTSLLESLTFLRSAWARGVMSAVGSGRGPSHIRRLGALDDAPVSFGLHVDRISWDIQLGIEGSGVHPNHGERLRIGDKTVFNCPIYGSSCSLPNEKYMNRDQGRTFLQIFWDMDHPDKFKPLIEMITGIKVHNVYSLRDIIRRGADSSYETDSSLNETGHNLLWVLRNWKTAPRKFNDQFRWVVGQINRAFPDQISDIEFEPSTRTVEGRFYPPDAPGPDNSLPMHLMADGVMTGLLHLTAVAGAKPGSIIAIDEMENQLHPHAIRSILKSMREIADERDLTVLLTTHSPVVMNEFKGFEDQFYVHEPGHIPTPRPLDELKDPDWLEHFYLGDLYDRLDFAAPGSLKG